MGQTQVRVVTYVFYRFMMQDTATVASAHKNLRFTVLFIQLSYTPHSHPLARTVKSLLAKLYLQLLLIKQTAFNWLFVI